MSYDLIFYLKKPTETSGEEIHRWVQRNILQRRYESEDGNFWGNSKTGVYFTFEHEAPQVGSAAGEETEEDDDRHFSDFEPANITFNLNFCRPDFFGREAFRTVDEILEQTELYVFDPQSGDAPEKPEKGRLYKEWSEQNDRFLRVIPGIGAGLFYMPREKSDAIWTYNDRIVERQQALGEEYFVPTIMILVDETRRPVSYCVWPQDAPVVLPEVDFVAIYRQKRAFLFRKVEEIGFLPYSEIQRRFGSRFVPYEDDCRIIHPDELATIKKEYDKMPLTIKKGDYAGISIDNLCNVPIEEMRKEPVEELIVEPTDENEDGVRVTHIRPENNDRSSRQEN